MFFPTGLDRTYRRMMRHHPFGYALYKPVLRSSMKTGSCGILDGRGIWTPLFDLNDHSSLSNHFLSKAEDTTERLVEAGLTWDPKLSWGAVRVDIGLEATAPTGLPVGPRQKFKVVTSEDYGAVLVTTPGIHHHRVSQESDIRAWFDRNKKQLLAAKYADQLVEHGLFIVTGTYSTDRCSITSWSDTSSDVYLGLNTDHLPGVHGSWCLGRSASGWNHYDAPDGDKYVVFMTGLWFKPRRMLTYTRVLSRTDTDMRSFPDDNHEHLGPREHDDDGFVCDEFAEPDQAEKPLPSRWAILIGINHYINPPNDTRRPIAPLRGSVEDADAMEFYFKHSLGLDDAHIRKLTAASASCKARDQLLPTKQNIVAAIREIGRVASRKDLVYIHFSGHGASLGGGTRYALVPMDYKEKTGGFLTAPEIKDLLQQLLEKDLIVTVVLDCCHSSGISVSDMTRGADMIAAQEETGPELTVRCLDDFESTGEGAYRDGSVNEPASLFRVQDYDEDDGTSSRAMGSAHSHWLSPTRGEYTLIAACREFERAYEMKTERDKFHGILTFCILHILNNEDALVHGLSGLSYWRLHWHLSEMVQQRLGMSRLQNALIKGATHRAFFGHAELDISAAAVVTRLCEPASMGSTLFLSTSEYLGARVGVHFDIYPLTNATAGAQAKNPAPLAVCRVESVKDGNIKAVLTMVSPQDACRIVAGCPSIPQNAAGEILVRLIEPDAGSEMELEAAADLEAIRRAWKNSPSKYGKLVHGSWPQPTCLQVAVDEKKREYQIYDREGAVIFRLPFRADDESAPEALVKKLVHLIKFYSVREMGTGSEHGRVVKLQALGTISPHLKPETRDALKYYPKDKPESFPEYVDRWDTPADCTIHYHRGDVVALVIDNPTSETLHVTLISLDTSEWSITSIHPEQVGNRPVIADTLEPGQRLLFPIEKKTSSSPYARVEACEEIVKVFTSTAPRDFSVVLLPPMEETGRGSDEGVCFPDNFLSLHEDVLDEEYRAFGAAGEVRRNVRFGIEDLNIKVLPERRDSGLSVSRAVDWDEAIDWDDM